MKDGRRRERAKNGAARGPVSPWLATAGGPPAFYDDPMSKVLGLDSKTSTLGAWFGFTSGSTLLMVALMALTSVVAWIHTMHERTAAATPEEIDVMKDDPPPPPPPEPEVKPEPAAPQVFHPREAPPPPPAQAAKVLTQEPDPNEPVDLTGNVIVQGNADAYAGGFTSANGTNANAVHVAAAPTGVPGGKGVPKPAPQAARDCSRPASLGGGADWSCPFPPEADTAQIDEAYVMLQVDVRPDGTPASVRVVADPGNGFGREARRCAMAKHYPSALDHDCNPIPGTTKAFRVHFSR
jgi:periplasmic protein TonB